MSPVTRRSARGLDKIKRMFVIQHRDISPIFLCVHQNQAHHPSCLIVRPMLMMVGRKRRAPLMMFGGWGSVRSDYNCPAQSESTHPALRECGGCQVTKFWPQILHNAATTSHIRHWFGRLAPPPAGQHVHNGPSIWRSSLFIFHQCQLDFSLVTQFATTSHRQIGGAYCRAVIGRKCTYR